MPISKASTNLFGWFLTSPKLPATKTSTISIINFSLHFLFWLIYSISKLSMPYCKSFKILSLLSLKLPLFKSIEKVWCVINLPSWSRFSRNNFSSSINPSSDNGWNLPFLYNASSCSFKQHQPPSSNNCRIGFTEYFSRVNCMIFCIISTTDTI